MPELIALNADDDDEKLLAVVVSYYHQTLKKSADAPAYLHHRGIDNPAVIDHFRLGFADRSLGLALPSRDSKAGWSLRLRLQQLGVFRSSGHEHFRGSITFPVTAADGSCQITDVYGRKWQSDKLRKGTEVHTYLGEERRGVWNVEAFGPANEIIVTPSVFDALSFWNAGYRNVTCTFSPAELPPHLIPALTEFDIHRVLATSESLAEKLLAAGLETFLVRLPPNSDVNLYARQTADPADALGSLLRHAEWVGKGYAPPASIIVPAALPSVETAGLNELLDEEDDEPDEGEPGEDGEEIIPADEPAVEDRPDILPMTPPVRSASPLPSVPPAEDVTVTDAEVVMMFGTRKYRVRGLEKNQTPDVLRVNILASNGAGLFVDTFDLYGAKPRASFIEQAAVELNVEPATVKKDVGRVLLKLEELQDAKLRAEEKSSPGHPDMTAAERDDALALLRSPDLLERIGRDFSIVGTTTNKLVAYLVAISRKLDRPLGLVVQSASAAGKTTLLDAALEFVPSEDRVSFSAITGQGLYYLADDSLRHKVLSIAEETGASKASYALKLLQSEGKLTIASTGKSDTGRLVTETYTVEGPVALFTTTTSSDVDEELLNRCLLLTVDEDRRQTRAVHQMQRRRETLAGLLAAEEHDRIVKLHQNAQRLLRSVRVVNPWAEQLTFTDAKTRSRRDHQKYLALIRTVALLHQHQRPTRTADVNGRSVEFIEVTLDDIQAANELATGVLGRTMDDLPAQTRNLLNLLNEMVSVGCERERVDRADFRFSARQAREFSGWGHSQTKLHVKRLADLEYLIAHRDREARRTVYELAYVPNGDHALPGLIDVAVLRRRNCSDGG